MNNYKLRWWFPSNGENLNGIHLAESRGMSCSLPFRLLVVDADRDRLRTTEEILLSAGYLVTCASSFDEAKRGLRFGPPDLLVTDVRLGAYNGVHLVVRAHTDYPSMPALVMDVHYDPVLESEANKAGAVYVGEPLDAGPLVALVSEIGQGSQSQANPSRRACGSN